MHLWEIEHDYYCNDSNYYSNDANIEYQSWAKFMEEWRGDGEFHYNLIFRWDWKKAADGNDLFIYFIMQRIGSFVPCVIHNMKDEDEPSVIEFLRPGLDYLKKLWEPIDGWQ